MVSSRSSGSRSVHQADMPKRKAEEVLGGGSPSEVTSKRRKITSRADYSDASSALGQLSGPSSPARSSGPSSPARSSGPSSPARSSSPSSPARSSSPSSPARSSSPSSPARSSGPSSPARSSGPSSSLTPPPAALKPVVPPVSFLSIRDFLLRGPFARTGFRRAPIPPPAVAQTLITPTGNSYPAPPGIQRRNPETGSSSRKAGTRKSSPKTDESNDENQVGMALPWFAVEHSDSGEASESPPVEGELDDTASSVDRSGHGAGPSRRRYFSVAEKYRRI